MFGSVLQGSEGLTVGELTFGLGGSGIVCGAVIAKYD